MATSRARDSARTLSDCVIIWRTRSDSGADSTSASTCGSAATPSSPAPNFDCADTSGANTSTLPAPSAEARA